MRRCLTSSTLYVPACSECMMFGSKVHNSTVNTNSVLANTVSNWHKIKSIAHEQNICTGKHGTQKLNLRESVTYLYNRRRYKHKYLNMYHKQYFFCVKYMMCRRHMHSCTKIIIHATARSYQILLYAWQTLLLRNEYELFTLNIIIIICNLVCR